MSSRTEIYSTDQLKILILMVTLQKEHTTVYTVLHTYYNTHTTYSKNVLII